MRMVRPWPVAVLNIPTLALLGNAAPANAMDKSPTCPLRGPSMTARRFGQVKVQDGDDHTAVWKMCDHMQRAKSIAITPCVLTVPAKCTCLMLRYGQGGLGLGRQCQHYLGNPSVNGSGLGEQLRALCHERSSGNDVSNFFSLLCAQVRADRIDFNGLCLYINHQCCKMPYFYMFIL